MPKTPFTPAHGVHFQVFPWTDDPKVIAPRQVLAHIQTVHHEVDFPVPVIRTAPHQLRLFPKEYGTRAVNVGSLVRVGTDSPASSSDDGCFRSDDQWVLYIPARLAHGNLAVGG